MSIEDEILAFAREWQDLIGGDHHKDRDCHFYISKTWSYGEPPKYTVEHNGYVGPEIERDFATSGEAHEFLREFLRGLVTKERAFVNR